MNSEKASLNSSVHSASSETPAQTQNSIHHRMQSTGEDVKHSPGSESPNLDEKLSNGPDSDLERNNPPLEVAAPETDPNLVDFSENDPDCARNWSKRRKWIITASMASVTFVVTFASTIFSTATGVTAQEFHVSDVVTTLGTSLFVLGFAFGPLIFGPLSEVFGRKPPIFIGCFVFAVFQIPVAVATNLETILVCRFIAGAFAVAPVAVIAGALVDMWDPLERAMAICVFAAGVFVGPIAGPIAGGFLTQSYLGWRWTAWLTLIIEAFFGGIGFLIIPETSGAKILQKRAFNLRHETKNWALHSKADETKVDLKNIVNVVLMRPFVMLVQEPILLLLTLYMTLVYGIIYLFFEAYPIAFDEQRGWNLGVGSLPFISLIIGVIFGAIGIGYSTQTNFKRSYLKHGKAIPEERLPPMIAGAICLPVGLFWFAWTSSPNITWVPQVLAGIPLGAGFYMTFWQGTNYIIDCYGFYANSAIAGNTLIRSIAAAGFPIFAPGMYHNLGVAWATSLLGFLCLVFVPVPVLFYMYGPKIRARSKWAPT